MKRIALIASAAIAAFTACHKNEVPAPAPEEITLYATMEEVVDTKTYIDADNNIRWSEGDQINGFMRSTLGVRYQVNPSSVGETSASFDEVSDGGLNAGTELDHIIAWYPYSSSVKVAKSNDDYTLNVALPAEQAYSKDSFGNRAFPMTAVSLTNKITFSNVCGAMKLQLKGNHKVASVKIEGNNGEKLSGQATVTAYTDGSKPSISMASTSSTSVTLKCDPAVQLNENTATDFIIALPQTAFTKGFTVTVTDYEGKTCKIKTDKQNKVIRSSLLVMPEVTLEDFILNERWIDLGLSVLWAGYNVGATSPEKYGGYYAWGETEKKSKYTAENYKFYTSRGEWVFIGSEISGTPYDVAHVKWGDGARMPTLTEVKELVNNCTFKYGTYNGVKGNYVKGPNGNSIFLPFAGCRFYDDHYDDGTGGYFWCGTYNADRYFGDGAFGLHSDKDSGSWIGYARDFGRSVRPVKEK